MIPKQLQNPDFRFCKLKAKDKIPFEKGWQNKGYRFDDIELINHIEKGGNYGVIGGYGKLRILDIDDKELAKEFEKKLKTFAVETGSGGRHFYFISDYENNHVLINEIGELRSHNYQVVGAGCIHPNGNTYKIKNDTLIQNIFSDDLVNLIKHYLREEQGITPKEKTLQTTQTTQSTSPGKDTSGSGLEYRRVLAMIREGKSRNVIYKEMGNYKKWNNSGDAYKNITYNKAMDYYLKQKEDGGEKENILTRRGQIESFWKKQPFFYDKSKIFWLWNKEEYKWDLSDEVDYLNSIQDLLGIETIDSKARIELTEGFKQIGRKHKPKDIKKDWVQFKDQIYDIVTGENFEASPEYFVTNPIPWNVGESEETPMMDKLLVEWVGEEYKQSLYEFIAYCSCLDKFMQRIFAFCGGGSNGKGTFIKLVYKFIGESNHTTSEIKSLSENRFESFRLFRKLLCVMGEVGYDDLKNTNMIKKIAGEDKLTFEAKGKNGFTDENTASCVCLTNSLPTTPDKSLGFYRKWMIIDFPNEFSQVNKDVIKQIPEIEFENLARKCIRILKDLYANPSFTNEGDFDERTKRYEERSNPVIQFVEQRCLEEEGDNTTLREFTNSCNEFLKSNHLKIQTAKQIGRVLRDDGFMVGKRKIGDLSAVVVQNLKLRKIPKLPKLPKLPRTELKPYKETKSTHGSYGSYGSSQRDLDTFSDEEIAKAGYSRQELNDILNKK